MNKIDGVIITVDVPNRKALLRISNSVMWGLFFTVSFVSLTFPVAFEVLFKIMGYIK
jgi:hypothetical protein